MTLIHGLTDPDRPDREDKGALVPKGLDTPTQHRIDQLRKANAGIVDNPLPPPVNRNQVVSKLERIDKVLYSGGMDSQQRDRAMREIRAILLEA